MRIIIESAAGCRFFYFVLLKFIYDLVDEIIYLNANVQVVCIILIGEIICDV